MIAELVSYIAGNFTSVSFYLLIFGILMTIILFYQKFDAIYLFILSNLIIILILGAFWIKISQVGMKSYSYIIPVAHLIIVLLSGFLLFNSIRRYQTSYSKIEFRLIIFYLINYLVWLILFLQDIYTIGAENSAESELLPYLGWALLILSLAAAISVYYIGKSIFFMKYQGERLVESLMFITYGFIMGVTLSDLNDTLIISSEEFFQQTFYFPDLFKPYGLIILAFLFIPYLIVAYKARGAIKLMQESKENGGLIDPVAIPRLKLTEIAMYVYILGAGFAIGLTLLPGFLPGFTLPFGLNTILSVPFIAIVDLTLFLAFQTPNNLKKRWRTNAMAVSA